MKKTERVNSDPLGFFLAFTVKRTAMISYHAPLNCINWEVACARGALVRNQGEDMHR